MELLTDNTQLDCELQEIYMISSHWKTDLDFVKYEMRYLKNTLDKYKTCVIGAPLVKLSQFQKNIEHESAKIQEIETKISEFLNLMNPVVDHSKGEFGLDLLEKYNELETAIKAATKYILSIRRVAFLFLEKIINARKTYPAVFTSKKPLPLKYQL